MITKDWRNHAEGVFLDFNGTSIKHFRVNGQEVDQLALQASWIENKIYIDSKLLKDKEINVVDFIIENQFNNDQFGLLLGKDPTGERYMYIQTVPYYASRIVPMFDQPNIKGKFRMLVLHSKDDTCVTTTINKPPVLFTTFLDQEHQDWICRNLTNFDVEDLEAHISVFDYTPYLSSYLLNLVCGPLASIEANPEQCHKGISMKIMCRSSLC